MLRALALLALAANLGFLAWTQGALTGLGLPPLGAGEREPQRLERQLRPESIVILNPSVTLGRPGVAATAPAEAATEAGSSAAATEGAGPSPAGASSSSPQEPGRERERSEPGR
jgi:hypothetical protein